MTKREMKVVYNDKDTNELKSVRVKGIKAADEKEKELKRLGHKEVMWTAIWQ